MAKVKVPREVLNYAKFLAKQQATPQAVVREDNGTLEIKPVKELNHDFVIRVVEIPED